jgi:hypothetical protein
MIIGALVWLTCGNAIAEEFGTFEGLWRTTNRKLDGKMTCVVTSLESGQWHGRFSGVWQGVAFDYPVKFSGSPANLRGTATIDGAHYSWTGQITEESPRTFKGTFGGSRYAGYFELKEKQPDIAR